MKNHILLALALGLTGAYAEAAHLTPEQALNRATRQDGPERISATSHISPTLQQIVGNLYVFDARNGFMILPNNDQAPAILGYSASDSFEAGIPALEWWLGFYNSQLQTLEAQADGAKRSTTKRAARPERAPIAPLTKTRWNQDAPYNDQCPELNGERSVTGCVATAMAQVLKYHAWPEKGVGEHSYNWKHGGRELSFDYGATTFDWADMTDTYNTESTAKQREAVSTLMLACGISVDMNYSPDESGASTIVMGQSLIEYFNYDKSLWMPARSYYDLYEWEDMIYADLADGLPVLYAGQGTAGGHQFICDGYSSDGYFHFNWGWGGMSNGYFLLTALNPESLGIGGGAGGFNADQQIALGVRKPTEGSDYTYVMYNGRDFSTTATGATPGTNVRFDGFFLNGSLAELPDGSLLGVRIQSSEDDSYDHYFESFAIAKLPVYMGYSTDILRFPQLEAGNYTITPAYYINGKWEPMRSGIGSLGEVLATVDENGNATFGSPTLPTIKVTEINAPATTYVSRDFPMTFKAVNTFSREYIGNITPVLLDDEGNIVAQSEYVPLDVVSDSEEEVTGYVGHFVAVTDSESSQQKASATITPGTYSLVFVDSKGNAVSEPQQMEVAADPGPGRLDVTGLSMPDGTSLTDPTTVDYKIDVDCTSGYFTSRVYVFIFPGNGGSSLTSGGSEMLYLEDGEHATATTHIDLSSLPTGRYFAMAACDNGSGLALTGPRVSFEITHVITGVETITDSVTDLPENCEIYDLQGRRCNLPLDPGIYVAGGRKIIVR